MSEQDVTPESLARAMAELRKTSSDFADFIDHHRPLGDAIHVYLTTRATAARTKQGHAAVERARDRLNAEAARAGVRWE